MSRIDDLIHEKCPDGIEYNALGDIAKLVRGNGMPRTVMADSGEIGAIHYGQIYTHYGIWTATTMSFVSAETAKKLTKVNPGDIIITNTSENIDDVCKAVAWVGTEPIVTGGHATVIHHHMNPKFLAYWFHAAEFDRQKRVLAQGTKVIDVSAKQLARIRVPVPPLSVQEEIVRILDSFTSLEAELEAELEARKKQYEYYRHLLLRRASSHSQEMHLAQLGHIITGRTPKSSDSDAWGSVIDFITPSDISNGMKTVISPQRMLSSHGVTLLGNARVPKQSILVTCIGADMGKTVINAHECVTNQQINSLVLNEDIDANYVFHVLSSMRGQLLAKGQRAGGTMPIINKRDFSSIQIPIPDMQTQHDVASTLDSFDSLVSDLSSGLPAEIIARRQQYEFYRDRLLSFKELGV